MNRTHRIAGTLAGALALSLTLAACGGGSTDSAGGSSEGGDKGTITLGFVPSWTDGLSTAYLLDNLLTKEGYTVEMQTLTEVGPLYTGLAQGDVDVYPSAWPEVTHASYMKKYGDRIEDIGTYYDSAKLTMAVPEYVDIDSIDQLKDNAKMFNGEIIGIEPGAGLTKATQEGVIPQYGLAGAYTLKTSSTAAMLTALKSATKANEPIVVTLWRPFWANETFPVKDLKDPKGALGEAEGLHFLAKQGFQKEFPEAAEVIGKIKLDDEQYGTMEDMVVNEYGDGKEAEAITAFLKENPDAVPQ